MAFKEAGNSPVPSFVPFDDSTGRAGAGFGQALSSLGRGIGNLAHAKKKQEREREITGYEYAKTKLELLYGKRQKQDTRSINLTNYEHDKKSVLTDEGLLEIVKGDEEALGNIGADLDNKFKNGYELSELQTGITDLRNTQKQIVDDFTHPLVVEDVVNVVPARNAVHETVDYIERLELDTAMEKAFVARATENWQALASRAKTRDEFVEMVKPIGEGRIGLRLDQKWIAQQLKSFDRETGLSKAQKDLNKVHLDNYMAHAKYEIPDEAWGYIAEQAKNDPEFRAFVAVAQMGHMVDSSLAMMGPNAWADFSAFVGTKETNGLMWDTSKQMTPEQANKFAPFLDVFEKAHAPLSTDEQAFFIRNAKPKLTTLIQNRIKIFDEQVKSEGYPNFVARFLPEVAKTLALAEEELDPIKKAGLYNKARVLAGLGETDSQGNFQPNGLGHIFNQSDYSDILEAVGSNNPMQMLQAIDESIALNGGHVSSYIQGVGQALRSDQFTEEQKLALTFGMFSASGGTGPRRHVLSQAFVAAASESNWRENKFTQFGKEQDFDEALATYRRTAFVNAEKVRGFVDAISGDPNYLQNPNMAEYVEKALFTTALYLSRFSGKDLNSALGEVVGFIDDNWLRIDTQMSRDTMHGRWWNEDYIFGVGTFAEKGTLDREERTLVVPKRAFYDPNTGEPLSTYEEMKLDEAQFNSDSSASYWLGLGTVIPIEHPDQFDDDSWLLDYMLDYTELDIPIEDSILQQKLSGVSEDVRDLILDESNESIKLHYVLKHQTTPVLLQNGDGEVMVGYAFLDSGIPQLVTYRDGSPAFVNLSELASELHKRSLKGRVEGILGPPLRGLLAFPEAFAEEMYKQKTQPQTLNWPVPTPPTLNNP